MGWGEQCEEQFHTDEVGLLQGKVTDTGKLKMCLRNAIQFYIRLSLF